MIVRLVSAALVAGFLAAVVATGLELVLTSPLILEAEVYEGQSATLDPHLVRVHEGHHEGHAEAAPEEWQPAAGLQRMAFTGLATLVGGVGTRRSASIAAPRSKA